MLPHCAKPSALLLAAALDPNEANMMAYGVVEAVVNQVWEKIAVEVKNYAPAHVTVAPVLLPALRDEREAKSRGVQGSDARIDVLGYWRQLLERRLTECLWGKCLLRLPVPF
jgi:hypothetical protein